jgi:CRP-like cAMP-binding protein
MPDTLRQEKTRNRILASLSIEDVALLQPNIVPVDLPLRKLLEVKNKRIEFVYFIECGLASVLAIGVANRNAEVGFIGRENMTGLAVIMGADRSPHETCMQSAGNGWRITAANLCRAMEKSSTLRRDLLLYGHTLVVQIGYTAFVNSRCKMEDRLARWLLMAHDRTEDSTVPLTHELLASMLGVRRPGVTTGLHFLEKQGLILAKRGAISILDREGLEKAAHGAYGAPEAEYRRLFG